MKALRHRFNLAVRFEIPLTVDFDQLIANKSALQALLMHKLLFIFDLRLQPLMFALSLVLSCRPRF